MRTNYYNVIKEVIFMYTSVITDQIDENLETALRIARLHGYTHVELHNVFGKSIE